VPAEYIKTNKQLANRSWNEGRVLEPWKMVKVVMIEKKGLDRNNPRNYCPISLTNSIIKIIERLVQKRLNYELNLKNIISPFQSGFLSKNRQTLDNLFYFAEKVHNARRSNVKNKACAVVFDISKAPSLKTRALEESLLEAEISSST